MSALISVGARQSRPGSRSHRIKHLKTNIIGFILFYLRIKKMRDGDNGHLSTSSLCKCAQLGQRLAKSNSHEHNLRLLSGQPKT